MFGLSKYGITGINKRNIDLIFEHNPRQHYPVADSKLQTKILAESVGVTVPKLFHVIEFQHDARKFDEIVQAFPSFVIKPDHGSGGGGILVIKEKVYKGYRKSSGDVIDTPEIRFHLQNILSGMFSLGSQPDAALIEQAVAFDPIFEDIAYQGVPDIRIIVKQGEPLMAMLRLPTKASDGKANLHVGGIGAGIDMDKGITTHAVQYDQYVEHHPETGHTLSGHTIPNWKNMLDIAVKMQEASGLGYVGVDIVLDKHEGAMVLEINARPGISIQVANRKGLSEIKPKD